MADVKVRISLNNTENSYIDIDKTNGLKSLESLSQSTAQPKQIFYGIVPNRGNIEVIDINGDIANMVKTDVISNSNVEMQVWANNKMVQKHISTDSEYNLNTKIFSATMTDTLAQWENATVIQSKTTSSGDYLYTLLKNVLSVVGYTSAQVDEMCSTEIIYGNTNTIGSVKDYLSTILVRNNYNETSNVKQLVEDVCVIAQLNVFQNDDGEIKFVSARPRIISNDNIINIPLRYQYPSFESDFILDNKYDSIKLHQYTLRESLNEVFTLNATFVDKDGNLDLETVGANAKILTDSDGTQYLCFIANIKNNSNMFTFRNVYSNYGVTPIQITTSNYDETTSSIAKSVNFDYSASSIDEYDFSSYAPATILTKYSALQGETVAFKIELTNENKSKVSIKLFGRVFTREEVVLENNDGVNKYEYNYSNNWLKVDTHFIDWQSNTNINIYDIITHNIQEDYANGIRTAKVSVICGDYYDLNGNKKKDWSKGEIFQVGDVVQVSKDNNQTSILTYDDGSVVYFRVVGRNFRKAGVPLIDLDLMEINQRPMSNVELIKITFIVGENKYVQHVRKGEYLTIPIEPQREGYTFYGWSTDGLNVTDVKQSDIQESATYIALFYQYNDTIANDLVGVMVDNGTLMFSNFDQIFRQNGYNVDWDKSNLQYSLFAMNYFVSSSTPIFTINNLTYGTTINLQDIEIDNKFKTYNSCSIQIGNDYSINFIDNDFKVILLPFQEANYQIALSSSSVFIVTT